MEDEFKIKLKLQADSIRSTAKSLVESGYKFTEEEKNDILSYIREGKLLIDEYKKIVEKDKSQ